MSVFVKAVYQSRHKGCCRQRYLRAWRRLILIGFMNGKIRSLGGLKGFKMTAWSWKGVVANKLSVLWTIEVLVSLLESLLHYFTANISTSKHKTIRTRVNSLKIVDCNFFLLCRHFNDSLINLVYQIWAFLEQIQLELSSCEIWTKLKEEKKENDKVVI